MPPTSSGNQAPRRNPAALHNGKPKSSTSSAAATSATVATATDEQESSEVRQQSSRDEQPPREEFWRDLLRGCAVGAAATAPMSLFMEAAHHFLPESEQDALPPFQVTMNTLRQAGLMPPQKKSPQLATTMAAHFAYGAAVGGVYHLLTRSSGNRSVPTGVAHGLGVWTTSYLGLLPALRLVQPPERHSLGQSLLMIGAHVVWGAALGSLSKMSEPRES